MTVMRVRTDGLNLRTAPRVAPGNVVASLPLGHEVELLDIEPGEEFARVRTEVDGASATGFAALRFLREPLTAPREGLLGAAVRQWIRFGRGQGKETATPFFQFVAEYWRQLGPGFSGLDGRDVGIPWSAAFVSFVMREAGGYGDFPFAAAHARYIVDAKKRRQAGETTAPFWLFRLDEHRPQIGDMICLRRQPGLSFDTLPADGFSSHCDIVVEVRDTSVRAIGGNVANSVSLSTFPLTGNGFLRQEGRVIAVMRNNR
jgi:hypothetical protein